MRKVCQSCADCVPIAYRVKVHRTLRGRLCTRGTRQHTPRLAAIHATRRRCGGVFQEEKRMMKAPERLLRLPEVEASVGLKKSAIYAMVALGTFPKPLRLTARAVVWQESLVQGWIQQRIQAAQGAGGQA